MTPYHNHRGDDEAVERYKDDCADVVRFVIALPLGMTVGSLMVVCLAIATAVVLLMLAAAWTVKHWQRVTLFAFTTLAGAFTCAAVQAGSWAEISTRNGRAYGYADWAFPEIIPVLFWFLINGVSYSLLIWFPIWFLSTPKTK